MILIGDSAADNHMCYENILPLTVPETLPNTAAVDRAVESAMVIGRMMFGSYVALMEQSVENAARSVRASSAVLIKLETARTVR